MKLVGKKPLFTALFFAASLWISNTTFAFESDDVIFHFRGTDTLSRLGGVLLDLGDINNDNFNDIAISSASPNGIYVFYGSNDPVDSFPDLFLQGSQISYPIDITGDGINDLITTAIYEPGLIKRGVAYIYKGFADSLSSTPIDSFVPTMPNHGFGSFPRTGFVNAGSNGDFVTIQSFTPNGPTLLYFEDFYYQDTTIDWTFSVNGYSHGFSDVGFVDFNGDNILDIYLGMRADQDTVGYVYIFYGPSFGSQPDKIISSPNDIAPLNPEDFATDVVNVGDFNGDSWEDLAITYQGNILIYYCGFPADTLYDIQLEHKSGDIYRAGDINGDGFNDLVSGNIDRSADGAIDIYLGGVLFDSLVDYFILRQDLPPLNLEFIGYQVSSAGDFNGDGFGDFMFACLNFFGGDPGDVFVIAGSSIIISGIEIQTNEVLPKKHTLSQNYPNPFNPSTTIEFALPAKSLVNLKIFNTLGEEVAVPLNKELSVGNYKVTWDGRDKKGNDVASGVYFYKLEAGEFVETKKMVLVR